MNDDARGIEIRALDSSSAPEIFLQIANLHRSRIRHGFLELLSARSLAEIYLAFTVASRARLWVATSGGDVAGFLAGCERTSSAYREVAFRRGLRLCWRLIAEGDWRVIGGKFFSVLIYPLRSRGRSRNTSGVVLAREPAELLAIAVDDQHRRKGIGRGLVGCFLKEARQVWRSAEVRVSTNAADQDSIGFYEGVGFTRWGTLPLHALTIQILHLRLTENGGAPQCFAPDHQS